MPRRTVLSAALALICAGLLAHACSHGTAGPGGGDAGPDSGPGTGPDAGSPDSGPADGGCKADTACGSNRWCEQSTGICRDAKPCPQGQGNCDYQFDPQAPDYCGGSRCYCDPLDKGCKPLHTPCTACATSAECGNDRLAYDYPADCVTDGGFADASVCIPRRDGYFGCPPGYQTPPSGNYCIPGGGHCGGQGACQTDADCDPHSPRPICDTAHQLCVGACGFDLLTGDSPACPSGQVCHLTPILAKLPPQDPNYGRGHCAVPCTSGTACGSGLVCAAEGIQHPVQRCRLPPPQCLDDVECPDSPATHSLGYCDKASHNCQTGCRTKDDCHGGYLCDNGTCVAETCLQAGGAVNGCDYGDFCCGETQSPPTCPPGVDAGACYQRPPQTWCGTCSADSDCKGSNYPSRSGNPNKCLDMGDNKKLCALGCEPGKPAQCPRSWDCETIYVACSADSDCGNQSGAHCDKPADGGGGTCTCPTGTDAQCPNDANNTTFCRSQKCVFGSVCRPACP